MGKTDINCPEQMQEWLGHAASARMRKLFTDRLGPRHLKDVEQTIHGRTQELAQIGGDV